MPGVPTPPEHAGTMDGERPPAPDRGAPALAILEPAPLVMVSVRRVGRGAGADEVWLSPGGQGVWVARMAAEMGAAPRVCAPVGGRPGSVLPALVAAEGIELVGVECAAPSAVWVSTGPDGDEADVAHTPAPRLDRHEVDRLYNAALAAGLEAGLAVLTGLADPGILPRGFYARLTRDLRENGVTVVADVSPPLIDAVAGAGVSVLKASHEELVAARLAETGSRDELISAVGGLREAGARAVLVSRQAEPALAHTGRALLEIAHPRLEELNPRGAGDAMTGALAAALARGEPIEAAMRVAVAAGCLNVTRRGLGTGERRAIEAMGEVVRPRRLGAAAAAEVGDGG